MRIDIQLDARPDCAARRARDLASTGVDGLFTFEGKHDVFLPLAAAASTAEVDLLTNVAIALPRSPLHLAHTAYDMHLMSRGRFTLGLGSQVRPHIENRYGSAWSKPAARMREHVLAVKAILECWQYGTPLKFTGDFTRHTLMPPTFNPGPNPYGVPAVHMGALGPVMTRTASEVADGLLVMPFNSVRHFRERTLPNVDEGLERSGRTRDDLEIVPQVIAAVGRSQAEMDAADRGVRRLLAFYGSTPAYQPVLDVEGYQDIQPRLNLLSKQGAVDAMTDLIDDKMLTTFAVRGTPEECATQIEGRYADVADRVCVYFPGYEFNPAHVRDLAAALHSRSTASVP